MNTLASWALCVFCISASGQTPGKTFAVGDVVDATFTDLRWGSRRLTELGTRSATVIYFATVSCPMVARTMPRIGDFARDYAAREVMTIVMNVGAGDAFVEAVSLAWVAQDESLGLLVDPATGARAATSAVPDRK